MLKRGGTYFSTFLNETRGGLNRFLDCGIVYIILHSISDRFQDLPGRRECRGTKRAIFLVQTKRRKPQMRRENAEMVRVDAVAYVVVVVIVAVVVVVVVVAAVVVVVVALK
jgi:hypothetical protein